MPSPEPRFEVPPEYAEVYERAYRRAYEEGQGQLARGPTTIDPPVRRRDRGKRVSPPSQGSSHRAISQPRGATWSQQWSGQRSRPSTGHRSDGRSGGPVPKVAGPPPVVRRSGTRIAGRAKRRRANSSTIAPLAGLMLLGAALLVGAFLLGRWTVSCMSASTATSPTSTGSGTHAGATASASPTAADTGQPGIPPPVPSGPYRGPIAPVRIATATAACTAPEGRDASNQPVSYAAANVLDGRLVTAWRCGGAAVGKELVMTLPRETEIARVGLVPGYAKTDPADGTDRYAQNNRITRVAWLFDGAHRVVQSMSGSASDRSLRTMRIEPVRATRVVLRVLAVVAGPKDTTMISTVRLDQSAAGSD